MKKSVSLFWVSIIFLGGCGQQISNPDESNSVASGSTTTSLQSSSESSPVELLKASEDYEGHHQRIYQRLALFSEKITKGEKDCFVVESYTFEGDIIIQTFESDGTKIIYTEDSRQDQFGSGELTTKKYDKIEKRIEEVEQEGEIVPIEIYYLVGENDEQPI